MRFYLDTSVFGGFFDEEFSEDTRRLFSEIANGRFSIVVSAVTTQELLEAPDDVRNLLARVPALNLDIVIPSDEAVGFGRTICSGRSADTEVHFRCSAHRSGHDRESRFSS